MSDNGPFRHHKATLWEGGIRVPAVVRWPAQLPRGKVSKQVAISMDFTATVAAACGVQAAASEPFDGIDLTPILAGHQPAQPRDLYWRINQPNQRARAIRSGKWKYILDGNINNMYDLEADPGETRDLFYVHPEIAAKLRAKLEAWDKNV